QELYSQNPSLPLAPASTLKLLTSAGVLGALDPTEQLVTKAVFAAGDPGIGTVTLVAGGDVTLAPDVGNPAAVMGHAGMGDLARAAAIQLRRDGIRQVFVALDDTLFRGAPSFPDWEWNAGTTWGSPVAPVAILGGRAGPGFDASTFFADPALAAAQQFATLLQAAMADQSLDLPVGVVAKDVTRAGAVPDAKVLAEVRSAPVWQLMEYQIAYSHNGLADALGRVAAVAAGWPGSFEGCANGARQALEALDLDLSGLVMDDCSGLSHGSRVTSALLTAVLLAEGGPLVRGLAVGGLNGTLGHRFTEAPALGNVRAKTGTLTGVTSLAGTVQTAGGRLLVFAVVANPGTEIWTDSARVELDHFVAGLAAIA
ncbi:MAG: D-alanyl-D-alanine carboxypeptidase/D-alanyl-D-alanine-endopeptidase, partial [Bifidobacteriaceae bacterium]|nr:D-alanyl-D-alanine carboxypeptidase/D-alanyl-D-alanine-endopeptidase [Bifidobacteriaceae bacterium]